ncbi:MAG: nuclear transport factor 2 family protein [Vicinamibacterales bacterium]
MRLTAAFVLGFLCLGAGHAIAQDAQAEKAILANERGATEAFAKGNLAGFKAVVAADGWAVDSVMGRVPVADLMKDFAGATKELKITSWDITDSKVVWIDASTAIHSYKWTGKGTDHGKPVVSPVWASTVWTKKNGNWMALFHHESPSPASDAKH